MRPWGGLPRALLLAATCAVAAAVGACSGGLTDPVTVDDPDADIPSDGAPGDSRCGDGIVISGEQCDDGRLVPDDGCDESCAIEPGWDCAGEPSVCTPVCGDGRVVRGEACDDGDTDDGDGCSSACGFESNWSCAGEPSVCVPNEICPLPPVIVDVGGVARGSCKAHRDAGETISGLYAVDTGDGPYLALCDMVTDGGGWTVVANNHNGDSEPSGCIPRIASTAALVCGELRCDQDFSARADGIAFTQMMWAAHTGSLAIQSYNVLRFNSAVTIPNADRWSLRASGNDDIAQLAGLPTIECHVGEPFTSASPGLRRVANERPFQATGGFASSVVLTFFDIDNDTSNPGRMSLTDASTSTGVTTGLDDFQDGHGCEDAWTPKDQRGASSMILIR